LCLSRQNLPRLTDVTMVESIRKGGYILSDMEGAQAVIVSTGSELEIAMKAQATLAAEGIATRVVSMPCTNIFDRQSDAYQEMVIPFNTPSVAIEAAHPDFWRKYVGRHGVVIGMPTFGESAPAPKLYAHFGITAERVVANVRTIVHRAASKAAQPLPDTVVPSSN
jgi:transketolase